MTRPPSSGAELAGVEASTGHATVPSPTTALDDVIARMDARLLELAGDADDRQRWHWMYGTFKKALRQGIVDGVFLDAAWAEDISCRMAELYFAADRAYEEDRPSCPEPWKYCFDRARSRRANVLQDMLLGMNAHINYDLPLATYAILVELGDVSRSSEATATSRELRLAFDATLRRRYFDFLQINNVAWQTMPELQDGMGAEFSRSLRLANRASFHHSRVVVEKLICDHRDRAWAHTLLIAMAGDDEELTSLLSFLSDFAMDAATLVDRLTLNPIGVLRAFRVRRKRVAAVAGRRPQVRLLVDHLKQPLTAKVARRALVEHGRSIHPLLEEVLAEEETPPALRDAILSVMAESPSPAVAATVARHWSAAAPGDGGAAIGLLAAMRLARVSVDLPRARLLEALEIEAQQARWLRECARGLGEGGSDVLLRDALDARLETAIRAMLEIVTIMHPGPAFSAPEAVVTEGDRPNPDRLVELARTSLPTDLAGSIVPALEASAVPPVPARSIVERLGELARTPDPWLQACALHGIVEQRLVELAPAVESLASSDSDLVRQTALSARCALHDPVPEHGRSPMLSIIEKVLYLKNVGLFQQIPSENLAEVARVAEERRFGPGDELIHEGAAGDELYVIVEGAVDVVAGRDRRLAHLGKNSVIGEMAILSDEPTSATCVAATSGRALRIRRPDFLRVLLEHPDVAIALIDVLTVRLRDTSAQVPSSFGAIEPGLGA